MICPKCGAKLRRGQKFCKLCGNVFDGSPQNNPSPWQNNGPSYNYPGPGMPSPVGGASGLPPYGGTPGLPPIGTVTRGALNIKVIVAGIAALILLIFLLFTTYCHFIISGPDDVVEDFVESFCDMDIKGAVECLDPSSQAQFKAALGIANVALSFIDIPIDVSDLVDIAPIFGEEMEDFSVVSTEVEYKSNGSLENLSKDSPFYNDLGKIFFDEAVVHTTLVNESGETDILDVIVKKYKGKWKIDGSSTL